jgi:hypothetical protein
MNEVLQIVRYTIDGNEITPQSPILEQILTSCIYKFFHHLLGHDVNQAKFQI